MTTNQLKNQHLMWRAGFGPSVTQLESLSSVTPKQLYKNLQEQSAKKPGYIDVADEALKSIMIAAQDAGKRKKGLNEEERRMVRDKNRDGIKNLNLTWLYQMIESNAQLREKMAFFWHGHFATRHVNIFYQQQQLDILRVNALGSFRVLLHEVSKSAAMLNFLNAQQNKKDHPNENFAREVMELFTLGRGNYTENDIKEAARAFTGWASNIQGDFIFRRQQHDEGSKTIFGKTGNFTGEQVLDMLLEKKETARYITLKIYKFFVNDTPDTARVQWLADRFYKSDYQIGSLMEDIFTSDWFYDAKNIGSIIKSPIILMSGIQRMLPMKLENEDTMLVLQGLLGQRLFYPPNVAGWPGGKSWIDSSTLMVRMRIPQMIVDNDELNIRPKTDDDVLGGQMEMDSMKALPAANYGKAGRPIRADINWKPYVNSFEKVGRENLVTSLTTTLLQVPSKVPATLIQSSADSSSRESFIRSATLQLMSVPEYQLC